MSILNKNIFLFVLLFTIGVSAIAQGTKQDIEGDTSCLLIYNLFFMSIDKKFNNNLLFLTNSQSECERILKNSSIKQEGEGQFVFIFQNNAEDELQVDQDGKNNRISIFQVQTLESDTTSAGNSATIKQKGNNNSAQIRQN